MSANDHVHPIFGAVLGSLLNPVENAKRLEGAMSETTTSEARWAEYFRLSAAAERLTAAGYAKAAEAETVCPIPLEAGERAKRSAHYDRLARDYLAMADRNERRARGEPEDFAVAG